MSLLDDVSIVVTPNGYKAGELYAVIPVPSEGAEEVTNGDFATDSDWTKPTGVTISGGSLNFSGVLSSENTYQSSSIEIGKRYLVTFTISNYTSGGVRAIIGSSGFTDIRTSNGTFTTDVVASGNTTIYLQTQSGTSTYSVDNVSVKEYTAADMDVTRATAATRVDEDGLVNYAEVIGSELVTCGDFECAVPLNSWTISGGNAEITSGLLNFTNATSFGTSVLNSSTVLAGISYEVRYTISNYISGSTRIRLGSEFGANRNANGDYVETVIASNTSILFYSTGANTTLSITNVSVKEVTRDNVPRIDYTGGGCPHILAEPQRTNLLTYSSDFSQSYWQKQTGIVPTYNTTETLSPDGTYNATKFIGNGSAGVLKAGISVTGVVARSVYLKSVTGTVNVVESFD